MAEHKKSRFGKLDAYIIFVLLIDTIIAALAWYLSFKLGEFPPAGAWTFFVAVFGGEAVLGAWIKVTDTKHGGDDA